MTDPIPTTVPAPADTGLPPMGFRGILLPTNIPSGDGRVFTRPEGQASLVRPLPLPLCAQDEISEGTHDGGRVVARIEYTEDVDKGVYVEGQFNPHDDNAIRWARDLANGYAGWVSGDMDMGQYEMRYLDADGAEIELPTDPEAAFDPEVIADDQRVFTRWRLCGGTLVSGAAFAEAKLESCEVADLEHVGAADDVFPDNDALVAAGGEVHTGGMVALIPTPEDAERFAVKGGDPVEELHVTLAYLGDDVSAWTPEQQQATLDAVRSALPPVVDGNVWGHASFNPGPDGPEQCAVHLVSGDGMAAMRERVVSALKTTDDCPVTDETDTHDGWVPHMTAGYGLDPTALSETGPVRFDRIRVAIAGEHHDLPLEPTTSALVAAAIVYELSDFADPHLDQPTPITVDADGNVFGHIAAWNTCHIGYASRCETPPESASGYRYFHTGLVDTTAGMLPVGRITLGTGHADLKKSASAALAHYDNSGTATAVVRAGQDSHGIWIRGRVLPGVSDEKIAEMKRSQLSGDWRGINGRRELIAALCVNVAGFPIPRVEALVASGGQAALVAAGMLYRPQDEQRALVAAAGVRRSPSVLRLDPDEVHRQVTTAATRAQEIIMARANAFAAVAETRREVAATAISTARLTHAARKVVAGVVLERAAEQVRAAMLDGTAEQVRRIAAAAAPGVDAPGGRMPPALKRYWLDGAGAAKWVASPHPFTALVAALQATPEIAADMTTEQIKGLAANLYHAKFHKWPGDHNGKAGDGK